MGIPTNAPKRKIYHITHIKNLQGIVNLGMIYSDAGTINKEITTELVGMKEVKARRLKEMVKCHPSTKVGEYVPFNFCPRSIMLYLLYKGNHPNIEYDEGQDQMIHLEVDLQKAIQWAIDNSKKWAFTNVNAAARYAKFFNDIAHLHNIDWPAVGSRVFTDPKIKEHKQAEFLIHTYIPLQLVEKIGVSNKMIYEKVKGIILDNTNIHLSVEKSWYF